MRFTIEVETGYVVTLDVDETKTTLLELLIKLNESKQTKVPVKNMLIYRFPLVIHNFTKHKLNDRDVFRPVEFLNPKLDYLLKDIIQGHENRYSPEYFLMKERILYKNNDDVIRFNPVDISNEDGNKITPSINQNNVSVSTNVIKIPLSRDFVHFFNYDQELLSTYVIVRGEKNFPLSHTSKLVKSSTKSSESNNNDNNEELKSVDDDDDNDISYSLIITIHSLLLIDHTYSIFLLGEELSNYINTEQNNNSNQNEENDLDNDDKNLLIFNNNIQIFENFFYSFRTKIIPTIRVIIKMYTLIIENDDEINNQNDKNNNDNNDNNETEIKIKKPKYKLTKKLITIERNGTSNLLFQLKSIIKAKFRLKSIEQITKLVFLRKEMKEITNSDIELFKEGEKIEFINDITKENIKSYVFSDEGLLPHEEYVKQHYVNPEAGYLCVVGKLSEEEENDIILQIINAFSDRPDNQLPRYDLYYDSFKK